MKAITIAAQQGQKIWTITNENLELAISRISLSAEAEMDIRNAVSSGKIATAHENRINFNGWIGEGYILIDPQTGAGAYIIAGGGNGSNILALALSALMGFIDALTQSEHLPPNTMSKNSQALLKAAKQAKLLGILALIADLYAALADDNLSTASAAGRAFSAVFAFAVVSFVIGAIFVAGGTGVAVVGGLIFSIFITGLLSAFNDIYFSVFRKKDFEKLLT